MNMDFIQEQLEHFQSFDMTARSEARQDIENEILANRLPIQTVEQMIEEGVQDSSIDSMSSRVSDKEGDELYFRKNLSDGNISDSDRFHSQICLSP